MKRTQTLIVAICAFCMTGTFASAQRQRLRSKPVNFVLDVEPMGLMFSPDMDDFKAEGTFVSEKVQEISSFTPNVRMGINFDTDPVDIDLMVGTGYLLNDAFSGSFHTAEVATRFNVTHDRFTIGPHLGVISLNDADWAEDAPIDLNGNAGWFTGVRLTVGSKICSFTAGFDIVNASYDVEVESGSSWTVNDTEVDISGVWINLGVILLL